MTQTSRPAAAAQNSDALAPIRNMFAMFPRIQVAAAELVLKQQRELFQFLSHRCDRDLEFVEHLRHTEDVSKLPGLFSKFMQGASQDYAEEARKYVDAGSHAATELAEQIREVQSETSKLAA